MLAAAAALAEHGSRIEKVFSGQGKSNNGMYVFEFFLLGEPKYVVVDDRLPIMDAGQGYSWGSTGTRYAPFMSGPSDNGAWWLPILEKGISKFTKTYADMNGGNEWEALRAFTGMPVRNYRSSSFTNDALYNKIKLADEKHYVMTAGCHYSQHGLVSGHAYTMLGVNDATNRIVVRNPWGSERYTGPGSD